MRASCRLGCAVLTALLMACAGNPKPVAPPSVAIAPSPAAVDDPHPKADSGEERDVLEAASDHGAIGPPRPSGDATTAAGALYDEAQRERSRGNDAGYRHRLSRIILEHRDSPFTAHAWIELGEVYFAEGLMEAAQALYEKAAASDQTEVAGFAHYKLAWVHRNLGKHVEALGQLVTALRISATRPGNERIAEEARRDLPGFYVPVGRPDRAPAFFRNLSSTPKQSQQMLDRLAAAYEESGKLRDAIALHTILAAESGADVCPHLLRIVDLERTLGAAERIGAAERAASAAGC